MLVVFPFFLFAQWKEPKQGQNPVDAFKTRKSMTAEELEKLGIELPGTHFTITGNIKNLKDSTLVFLSDMDNGKSLAQQKAVKGRFKLHGQLEHEGLYAISFPGYSGRATVFMANDSVFISGDAGQLEALTIKGPEMVTDFEAYRHRFDAESVKLSELNRKISIEKTGDKRDSLIGEYKKIVVTNADQFLKEKAGSPVSCFVLFTLSGLFNDQSELEERFNRLLPEAQKGWYAELIKRKLNENKINPVGSMAPLFKQQDTNGQEISLDSFRGKYVLIDFWASWCKPCMEQMPGIVSVYRQYKNKNFTILGVSLDMEHDSWMKAVADNNMDWTQVSDLRYWDNEVAGLYKIESIPQNILVDRDGKIVAKNLTVDQLQKKLALLCK